MGKETYVCAYCNKSFTDSHEARKKHLSGRAHKANVKLWYDAVDTGAARTDGQWTHAGPASTDLSLPPSLRPPPPTAFAILPAEWGS
ncbi:hypothetical protein SDRG_09576 [Saprolegnia diclina VS20]|uniref:U1-type domain-containing protein n=1 Tax=Saprolegnia diclina (strain VS20) TaxID=1156394 RepID=T0RSE6_SAPDV|nr:hypothetical protein SDRG_09576 [Saprolegnia diclina VS20]EQC33057.1 hypothetical protein SDRG_09576 [Saprolegnia diclina VS20]|eukprot:XP_008613743.1 hypothetical protein SDRG_09576 [Saprolegnia diclina VS20]